MLRSIGASLLEKVAMSSKGQTINDRLNAAKYTLAGRALSRCICKATTEELMRPKKKHLDYLAAYTFESDLSMQQLASQLIERTTRSNWVVVYKALITVHHLMSHGSERFTQYLASSNYTFQPENFQTRVYSTSAFIRRYALYITQKALSYRTLAIDLCRKQRTKEKVLRSMPIERLLETLPVVQKQLDTLLDFGCTAEDLNNSIIVACFDLLFQDAIRLFANYNDGVINLFEKYFDLNKKMCREAFEAYKKFLDCADRVADFLKVAEAINLDRGEIPDFRRAPSSLLQALEQHLINLETNKKCDKQVTIDTSSATLPSFSTNLNFELSLSMVNKGLDTQLSTSSGASQTDDAIEAINLNQTPQQPIDTITIATPALQLAKPVPKSNVTVISNDIGDAFAACNNNIGDPSLTQMNRSFAQSVPHAIEDLKATNIFGPQTKNPTEDLSVNIIDFKPPGYADGSLLTPECTLPTHFDPSIDVQTQQQLINIKREQTASRQNHTALPPGIGASKSQGIDYVASRSKPTKPKHESIFEDLEKTMRQSLVKVEEGE